jgi:hypothetical protein
MTDKSFNIGVTTPDGVPLGGSVDITISDNGDWRAHFSMHSSSIFGNFDFTVRAFVGALDSPIIAFVASGHVSEVDTWPHDESGNNPLIKLYWNQLQSAKAWAPEVDPHWGGLGGDVAAVGRTVVAVVEELAHLFVDALTGVVGGALGVVIGVTSDAVSWLGATMGPGTTLGVIGGAVIFLAGAATGADIVAVAIVAVAGAATIGTVVNELVDYRSLNDAEQAFAARVFGGSLNFDNIVITNLSGAGGRGFTAPGVDGKTYCNIGPAYDNPTTYFDGPNPAQGELLIHELTHAWQIQHSSFLPGLMCSALITQGDNTFFDDAYAYGDPGIPWDDLGLEQQAAIVDQWFGSSGEQLPFKPMDQQNPYYGYIWNNILEHNPPENAPGTLQASASSALTALGRTATNLDVFWAGDNGAIDSQYWFAGVNGDWPQHPQFSAAPAGCSSPNGMVAAVDRSPQELDLFWVGQDGAIASTWWIGGGQGWGDHAPFNIAPAGSATPGASIAAVGRTPKQLDVFWIAPDGSVMTHWWDAAPGCGWDMHAPFAIAPPGSAPVTGSGLAVASRGPGHLDVFWVTPDGAIGGAWWDGAPGNNWGDHTNYEIAPPGSARAGSPVVAVARTPDHMDVFWVTPDGSIGSAWYDAAPGCNWWDHQPFTLAGPGSASPTGGLAAVARTPDHLDVFWVTPDGAIGSNWWDAAPNCGWGNHSTFNIAEPGSAATNSPVAATARMPEQLDVFWVGRNGAINSNWWNGAQPNSNWSDHRPFTITAPTHLPFNVKDISVGDAVALKAAADASAAATAPANGSVADFAATLDPSVLTEAEQMVALNPQPLPPGPPD